MPNQQEDIKAKILNKGVIVAGHPRSGTSLACQLLETASVDFPSDFEGDEYNKGGYYELAQSKKLSKELINKAMTVENTREMNKIIDLLNNCSGRGGLKLVRMAALFFYRHLTRDLKAVFVYRNPADVKSSLFRRGISKFRPNWVENNNALIAGYENIEDSIIISFETLLNRGKLVKDRFAEIGFDIDLSIINPEDRTQKKSKIMITEDEKRLYKILQGIENKS
jgi:hypothetical protein